MNGNQDSAAEAACARFSAQSFCNAGTIAEQRAIPESVRRLVAAVSLSWVIAPSVTTTPLPPEMDVERL